ncbi:hypothetical protein TCAL_17141 [Tigriopus californicus]|uniref:PI3K/PI4K catalytic domain-containing protein n=1 Tax=Tigriopus californicus TaxID=6832 RepID=A0A553P1P2_TIGCA|nr:hypothetical protein TCAL_17141 [Tigriopus californicus]
MGSVLPRVPSDFPPTPQTHQLELQHVSPQLLKCRNLELAVPGNYVPNRPSISIAEVEPALQGHEDLRQDERVMQFFSLVNSLLLNDPETFRRNLTIQRFAVIPLSTNSGLIGWVPNSDTLHALIKDYREKKKILLNIEHRIMQRMTPQCGPPASHEQSGSATILAKILLLKPQLGGVVRPEDQFHAISGRHVHGGLRARLGRSASLQSPAGRMSGKILHIDFGDCFEVAMTREKFPRRSHSV